MKVWNIEYTIVPNLQIKREDTQLENTCDIVFEKAKGLRGTANRTSVYAKAVVQRVIWKMRLEKFWTIHKKNCGRISFFDKLKLCRSAASLKTRLWPRSFLVIFYEVFNNTCFVEHQWTTASDYGSMNSSEWRIGNWNCKLWYKS